MLQQRVNGGAVALQALALNRFKAIHTWIRNLAKILPAVHIANMHLHRRQLHRFQRVQNRHAGVGVSRRVDNYAITKISRLLNCVHQRALMVTLHNLALHLHFLTMLVNQLHQIGVAGAAVNLRLPPAQQIQVGAVNNHNS